MTIPLPMVSAISELHDQILNCRACHTAGYISGARPLRHPWTERQRTMVVGQAPGAQTEAKRFHFAGPGGVLLGRWLAAAGYDANSWRDQCYVTSLTRCFPGKAANGKGDRKPSPPELALCRPFLDAELRLVQPRILLAVGGMAIEHFIGKQPLTTVVGRAFEMDGRMVLPLPHPSGVSRWLNTPAHQQLVEQAIRLLAAERARLNL